MASQKPRIQLVLDWDGTMTTADTTAVIGSRCLAKARELAPADLPLDKLPKDMKFYSDQYIHEYKDWKQSHELPPEDRKTVDEEVSYLSQSKHVEEDSFLRVRNAVLNIPDMGEMERKRSMRYAFMVDAGRQAVRHGEVQIREPAVLKKLIETLEETGNMWGIVSVSWSRRFILGALIEAGLVREEEEDDIARRIRCNELLAPRYIGHANKVPVLCSARDKQHALQELLTNWDTEHGTPGRQYPASSSDEDAIITVYVGDSSTDIGCLAGPSIGMYLNDGGQDDALVQIFKRLQIDCLPINELPTSNAPRKLIDVMDKLRDEEKPPHLICQISTLQELNEWILALS